MIENVIKKELSTLWNLGESRHSFFILLDENLSQACFVWKHSKEPKANRLWNKNKYGAKSASQQWDTVVGGALTSPKA